MAEIVNLRRARKAKARVEKDKAAEESRARFGRAKAEKAASRAEQERAAHRLDELKRECDD